MKEEFLNERGKNVLVDEMQRYYKNFGSMNKNDFEVLLFHALAVSGNKEKSNFELSRMLRIPESKIKRLRYEADLKFGAVSEDLYRKEKLQQLEKLLTQVSYKNEGKIIEFVVEDIALRQFLDNILKSKKRFSDSSFNSEIVKINFQDLEILLRESVENSILCDQLLDEAEKLIDERVSFAELIPCIIKVVANSTPLSLVTDVTLPVMIKGLQTAGKSIAKYLKK